MNRTILGLALCGITVAALTRCGSSDDEPSGVAGASGAQGGTAGDASAGSGGSATGGSAGKAGTGGAAGSGGVAGAGGNAASGGTSAGGSAGTGGTSAGDLASKYPGDVGIENDPDVVWVENFEEGSVSAVTARYDDFKNAAGMELVGDVPAASHGKASLKLTAGGAESATDLYKNLSAGYDEWFVRYYAKYAAGVQWHHTGVWIGGYNPPINWPNPQAGLKPNGDDRFSISLEPVSTGPNPRLDTYNYWMKMHSWMDNPSGNTAYYGNTVIHQSSLTATDDAWFCAELHVKINPSASSGAGAELAIWINDQLIQQFTDASPLGYWIKDKFCPEGADGKECTDYPPPSGTQMIALDQQYRSVGDLKLNYFWPQNYVTEGPAGPVYYDDMVVAKSRVGCVK
ncbi:MAG: hypothetical protein HY898_23785 [Deltaproteobacteria bacterium]|nr:hypothetical protein [Deltaproteobacteria bacterium]